jgi:ABC-type Na+ efflux pump permease subunit
MIFGIQKKQWLLILSALSVPLILNALAIWQDVGTASILKMWNGTYPQPLLGLLAGPYNPLPEIFLKLLIIIVMLGLLAWLMVFISNKVYFQKQPRIAQVIEALLMALFVAVVFEAITGYFMPLVWIPLLHDTLGLPGSTFMGEWSRLLVFPITAIIIFCAIIISGKKTIDTLSTPM